jgi:phosphoribosylglycinamide formyltransferase-1
MREKLALLISGGGTTMHRIIQAAQAGELALDIGCVIASTPDAKGIQKAQALGIPPEDILTINPQDYKTTENKRDQTAFGEALLEALTKRNITVVTQNGWLPLTPEIVIEHFKNKIFNQHPGPVPEFGGAGMYGRRVHAAVLLFRRMTKGEQWTEIIAQRVHKNFDEGHVLKSKRIEILPTDTVDDLQQRVLPVEHELQIALLKDVINDTLKQITRESLVKVGEEEILHTAKKTSKLLYPQG